MLKRILIDSLPVPMIVASLCGSGCSTLKSVGRTSRMPQSSSPTIRVVQGEDYFKEALPFLDSATQSIDIMQFSFAMGKTPAEPKAFADKLIEIRKTRPTVRIRVLLQGGDNSVAPKNHESGDYLAAGGVEVHYVTGLKTPEETGTNHSKVVAIDGNRILAGSTNWTHTSIALNNEIDVMVESPVFGAKFQDFVGQLLQDSEKLYSDRVEDGPYSMMTDDEYQPALRKLIQETKDGGTLDLSMYYFAYRNDKDTAVKEIFDDLKAAQARKVRIRLFLERNTTFAPEITCANRRVAKWLNEAGIPLVYFDKLDKISHTKLAIQDQCVVLLGSSNWYGPDFKANHQVNWIVRDPVQAKAATAHYSKMVADEGTLNSDLPPFDEAKDCPPSPMPVP